MSTCSARGVFTKLLRRALRIGEAASDTADEMQLIEVDQERVTAMLKALPHPARLEVIRSLITAEEGQCIA